MIPIYTSDFIFDKFIQNDFINWLIRIISIIVMFFSILYFSYQMLPYQYQEKVKKLRHLRLYEGSYDEDGNYLRSR